VTRICKLCKKPLSAECDFCREAGRDSLNVRASSLHKATLNCLTCHRSGMPIGRPVADTICHECERKAQERGDASA